MSNDKPKPYLIVVIISIIFITLMSIGIFVIMSGWIQKTTTRYTEASIVLDNFGDLAETDIQMILQDDSAKYEVAYSQISELYYLNDLYIEMIEYNLTHTNNFTQQDFDEIKIEFTLKMRSIISIVNSTFVYLYNSVQLEADATNNYTYSGFEFLFIINQWYTWSNYHTEIHPDIKDYVNASFILLGVPIDIPEIKLNVWSYHLYNNLSILAFFGAGKSINYITNNQENLDLSLVNLSLDQLKDYSDGYVLLNEKTNGLIQDFNNTLITLALSGVLMGFATSFDKLNYRRISLVVGLLVLLLAIFYFFSAFGTYIHMTQIEEAIIGVNEFVYA